METLEQLRNVDFFGWLIVCFLILSAVIAAYKIICEFLSIIGKPIGTMKQRKADHELLVKTVDDLRELHNKHEEDTRQSIQHDEVIRNELKTLTRMFIDKQIDDMRYEILDFASSLSSGRKYNKEQFDHILKIDEKYKKILEENGLENGQVTVSVEYINEVYKDKLRNGF